MNAPTMTRPIRAINAGKGDFMVLVQAILKLAVISAVVVMSLVIVSHKLFSGKKESIAVVNSEKASINPTVLTTDSRTTPAIVEPARSIILSPENKLSAALGRLQYSSAKTPALVKAIGSAAATYKIDPLLLTALAATESGLNNLANSEGKLGILPLGEDEAAYLAAELKIPFYRTALLNPQYSLNLGAYKLSKLLEMAQGNQEKALVAFKAGTFSGGEFKVGQLNKDQLISFKDKVLEIQSSLIA